MAPPIAVNTHGPAPAIPPPARDLIYAAVTPPGEGAIATLLLDGDGALEALARVFRSKSPWHGEASRRLVFGRILDLQGRMVDEAVAAILDARESETGRTQVELSCHGGVGANEAVKEALRACGFRPALPGELLARAHRAGRLSLPVLEARLRLEGARTARQLELLLGAGDFQAFWERHGLEAALGARQRRTDWREGLHAETARALAGAEAALRLLRTHRVLIAGPANAGKSTLANRLLREDLAIVGAQPGTTRDLVERPAVLRGLALTLSDGAGLREPSGAGPEAEIEREGQARVLAASKEADLILFVADGSREPAAADRDAAAALMNRPALAVLNKTDLGAHPEAEGLAFLLSAESLRVSALSGAGLDRLEAAVERRLLGAAGMVEPVAPGAPFTLRQRKWVAALARDLQEGLDGAAIVGHIRHLSGTRPDEVELAEVFREAAEAERPDA